MASLGELFVELGVFADTKEADEFKDKLEKVAKQIKDTTKKTDDAVKKNSDFTKGLKAAAKGLAGVITAVTGAAMALNKLTNDLVQSNQQMLNLTRNSDIAMGTFQKWNNVGKMLGVQNAAQQIEGLNQKLFRLRLTGEGAEGFMLAGINPMGQSAEGVMEQLRNRVSGLNDTAATYLLQQMGLDPSMLHLLRMTRQEFEELGATVRKYQLTPEQSKQIQEMNKQLEIAKIKLQYLKDRAILAIMPYWVKFMQSLARVTEFFTTLIQQSPGVQLAIKNIAIAIGILLAATHPFIATLTALFLLIDDFMAYKNGGGSMIGVFLKLLEDFEESILNNPNSPQWLKDLVEVCHHADKLLKFVKAMNPNPEQQQYNALKGIDTNLLAPWQQKALAKQLQKMESKGYEDTRLWKPDTGKIDRSIDNSSTTTNNNDNRKVMMNNTIFTTQTGQSVQNDLLFAQNYALA